MKSSLFTNEWAYPPIQSSDEITYNFFKSINSTFCCKMNPRLPILILQIFLGSIAGIFFLSAFAYYTFWFQNYTAAIGFILSAVITFIGVHLNILIFRCQLNEWYDVSAQDSMQSFAVTIACVTFVVSGYSFARAIVLNEQWNAINSWYISAFATGMCFLLSCWLYGLTRWTRRFIELSNLPLLSGQPRTRYRRYGN